jgi:hypothetical protein
MPANYVANAEIGLANRTGASIPPIGIKHIFIWMTLTAAAVSVENWLYPGLYSIAMGDEINHGLLAASQTLTSAIAAMQLTAMWVLVQHRDRSQGFFRQRLPSQPGHWSVWISVLSMVMSVYAIVVYQLDAFFDFHSIDWTLGTWRVYIWTKNLFSFVVTVGIAAAVYAIAARNNRGMWRWLFAALGLTSVLCWFARAAANQWIAPNGTNVDMIYGTIYTVASVPSFAMMLLAIAEFRNGIRRDWIHWIGIVAYVLVPLLSWLTFLGMVISG